jgi:L-rhamnose mutarotase
MTRYGSVLRIRPEAIERYKIYHAAVWPEVLEALRLANVRNYSIYLKDDYLFGYYEYCGTTFEADMAEMAENPKVQEWWSIMEPMQSPIDTRDPGEWWASMQEVFHMD